MSLSIDCGRFATLHWRDFTNPADGGRTVGRGCAALDDAGADRAGGVR